MYALTQTIEALLEAPVPQGNINAALSCPFHRDRQPSFTIHQETGVWNCFSCGRSGSIYKLADALGKELGPDIYYDQLIRGLQHVEEPPPNFASLANQAMVELRMYPEGRDLLLTYARKKAAGARSLVEHFNVGYNSHKDALVFPYWDNGKVPMLKYRYRDGRKGAEPGSKRSIYNVEDIREADTILLCEGESDTHAAYRAIKRENIPIRVAGIPGANVSTAQWQGWALDMLRAKRIFVAYDDDSAGDRGFEPIMRVFGTSVVRRIKPTRGKDLSEHLFRGGSLGELGLEN